MIRIKKRDEKNEKENEGLATIEFLILGDVSHISLSIALRLYYNTQISG